MVISTETVYRPQGYGFNSSDDEHETLLTSECECQIMWHFEYEHGQYEGMDLVKNALEYHETKVHIYKKQIEEYIKQMKDVSESIIKTKFFNIPRKVIDYILEWSTTNVSQWWKRDEAVKVYKEVFC